MPQISKGFDLLIEEQRKTQELLKQQIALQDRILKGLQILLVERTAFRGEI